METVTKSAQETFDLGEKIGSSLRGGEVIAFMGDLGAGKTTFIQGLAKGIGIESKITSPTFILMRSYKGGASLKKIDKLEPDLYHLDLYRIEGNVEEEVKKLGLFDLLEDPKNIVAIEWAEKIKDILPHNTIWVKFGNVGDGERKIEVEGMK